MFNLGLLATIAFAVLFYRAADYERMSPWAWALGSFALSMIVTMGLHGGLGMIVIAQILLFGVMTWYNAKQHA